jgi:cholinesterase
MAIAYSVGASSADFYSPARFAADHDIVAVSINYRLGILGFPMTPILKDQNLGLLDQRLGIEWVRDNIAAFGGDPSRITIFGESAGGASVDYYSYAWKDDPIVAGLISQSGTAAGLIGDLPSSKAWSIVSKAVGCGDASEGSKSVACMKKVPVEKIMANIGKVGAAGSISTLLSFWPVADNKTIFADILNREKRGGFMKRPMLIGNVDKEGNILAGFAVLIASVLQANADQIPANMKSTVDSALKAIDWLSNTTGFLADSARGLLTFVEDGIFSCPAASAAAARAAANVPVWRFKFAHRFENGLLGGVGGYHISDVPIVMGTLERKVTSKKIPDEQERFIKNTMTAWASFAKDPVNGLTKLGWPKYQPKSMLHFDTILTLLTCGLEDTLVQLGGQNKAEPVFMSPKKYDQNCAKYVIPPSAPKYTP